MLSKNKANVASWIRVVFWQVVSVEKKNSSFGKLDPDQQSSRKIWSAVKRSVR